MTTIPPEVTAALAALDRHMTGLQSGAAKALSNATQAKKDITALLAALTPAPTLPHTAVPLAANSPWLTTVDTAPLAANSAAVITDLNAQVDGYWNGVAAFNVDYYNNSFYPVAPGTPTQTMGFYDWQGLGYTPNNLLSGAGYFLNVPIPAGAVPANGSDHAMSIYDASTDRLWEFWNVIPDGSGGWKAGWGGRIDNVSTSPGYFPPPYGAIATGLIFSAGMISVDDITQGHIDHAMYFMTRKSQPRARLSWPAQRGDGTFDEVDIVRQGQRLRLDPTLDLSTFNLTTVGMTVAVAAQKYGFIVCDTSGAVGVATEASLRYVAKAGVNPWTALLAGVGGSGPMVRFPWTHLQAIEVDWGKPAPPA